MTSWQTVRAFAGAFLLLTLALGAPASPFFISQWWLAVSAFIGLNLLQSGFTRWCLLERMLARFGMRQGD